MEETATTAAATAAATTTTSPYVFSSLMSTRSPLFNNEIEVHRPVFKRPSPVSSTQAEDAASKLSLNLTELYHKLKLNYEKSKQDFTLRKRFRNDDQPRLGFDNVNVVVPGMMILKIFFDNFFFSGRFNPTHIPNGVTHCKKDSSTNGTRVCSQPVQNNCQGGFKIGGNCNGQERLDNSNLPQSDFQMGDEQVGYSDLRSSFLSTKCH